MVGEIFWSNGTKYWIDPEHKTGFESLEKHMEDSIKSNKVRTKKPINIIWYFWPAVWQFRLGSH